MLLKSFTETSDTSHLILRSEIEAPRRDPSDE
jgi:hypothetical protein